MADYFVDFTEHTFTINEPDPNDEWDHGQYGLNVTLNRLRRTEKHRPSGYGDWYEKLFEVTASYGYDDIEPGETAYVVVVEYTDGDTFGCSGYWNVPAIKAKREAADDVVREINSGVYDSKVSYVPWEGYFAHLSNVWVEEMIVER